jgi:hypothetical protein
VTLLHIPVDTRRFSLLMFTSLPEARKDPETGKARADRTTDQPLYVVGVLVGIAGERTARVLDVLVPGEPTGLV